MCYKSSCCKEVAPPARLSGALSSPSLGRRAVVVDSPQIYTHGCKFTISIHSITFAEIGFPEQFCMVYLWEYALIKKHATESAKFSYILLLNSRNLDHEIFSLTYLIFGKRLFSGLGY